MKRNPIMEKIRERISPDTRRSVDLSVFVADRIYDILYKKNISQRDLADRLGKSEAEISKWMQGTHNFTLSTIAKIECALGETIFDTASIAKEKEYVFVHVPVSGWSSLNETEKKGIEIPLSDEWSDFRNLCN